MEAGERAGLDKCTLYRLRLAIDEIATNVILHGYGQPDPAQWQDSSGPIPWLGLRVAAETRDSLTLALEDGAAPFDPSVVGATPPERLAQSPKERAEGGLGLFLANRSVEELDYERVDNVNRNLFTVSRSTHDDESPNDPVATIVLAFGRPDAHAELSETLEASGHSLLVVGDARELVRLLHAHRLHDRNGAPADIILFDFDFPEWGDAIDGVRSAADAQAITIVAVLRGGDDARSEDAVYEALVGGADDCLPDRTPSALVEQRIEIWAERARLKRHASLSDHDRLSLEKIAAKRESLQLFEHEIAIGRQIQSSFLPGALPRLRGWQLAARLSPARAVSGDFYDTFELSPQGCLSLVVADVCDKGTGAALFMGLTRSLLRAFAQRGWSAHDARQPSVTGKTSVVRLAGGDPETVHRILLDAVALTNDYIATTHADLSMFATVFFAVLVPLSGELHYINAGHPPAYLIDPAGRIRERLSRTGPAVGVFQDAKFDVGRVRIETNEMLFAYTDGVTESRSEDGAFFGEERLENALVPEAPEQLLRDLMTKISDHVGDARQHDDITMLAVRRY